MLDDFILEQPIAYKTILNSVKSNKISHAYILESNGYSKVYDFALSIAKYLFCPHSYSNNKSCKNCFQCSNIEKNDFMEIKIINPSGMWIKKNELEELQAEFSKKSFANDKKLYIINNAEKLNASSSNSILKFLEEPEDGIIAILIVENTEQLLSTIVSRCQIISLKPNKNIKDFSTIEKISHNIFNKEEDIKKFIDEEKDKNVVNCVVEFIKYYEKNHYSAIINMNKIWHQYFKEKNELFNAFTILLLFYKDVLNDILGKKIEIFTDFESDIKQISSKNEKSKLISKINVIINLREKIKFNVNNNLLMDKLIIELEGCEIK